MKNQHVIAVFSDCHGNLGGLQKAFEIADKHGAKQIYYLGDSIGYIPSTDALELLRLYQKKIYFVKGNHENQLLSHQNPFTSEPIKKHALILKEMTLSQLEFISNWPEKISTKFEDLNVLFLHGSPEDPMNGYIYFDSDLPDNPCYSEYQLIFVANTHIPFIRKFGESVIVNVGSVGLPRDHGKVGSLALLNLTERKVSIFRYPIADIQDQILSRYAQDLDDSVKNVFARV